MALTRLGTSLALKGIDASSGLPRRTRRVYFGLDSFAAGVSASGILSQGAQLLIGSRKTTPDGPGSVVAYR